MLIVNGQDYINQLSWRQYQVPAAVADQVQDIIAAVRTRGDEAVLAWETKFNVEPKTLKIPTEIIDQAAYKMDSEVKAALELSIARVKEYQQQLPVMKTQTVAVGKSEIIFQASPVEKVGIYVPGGRASYPSTVVMTATLARIAGVRDIILCTPPGPTGIPHAVTLGAAAACGVDEVFCCGGAQAIAAMAFGTESIPKVDKIVGPGNIFVTAAKREVFGVVDIDGLAGPSEAMLVLDPGVPDQVLKWCIWDLRAQAEHDPESCCVLVTTEAKLAERLALSVQDIPGHIVVCAGGWAEAQAVIEAFAPEHLELIGPGPESLATKIKNVGAVFVGPLSAIAIGDYVAGPSHVLPTGGSARSFSGLWTGSFMRVHSVIKINPQEFPSLAAAGETLALSEGLPAHAKSLALRRGTASVEG